MARTAQTHRTPGNIEFLRKSQFQDHTGATATRARFARTGSYWEIPTDFEKNPVFALQIYSTLPLNLDEPDPNRSKFPPRSTSPLQNSNLRSLVSFLGNGHPERPPPVFEIYPEQPDVFACLDHQRKEIAHRKARIGRPDNLLIPKVARADSFDSEPNDGFFMVITSEISRMGQWSADGDDDELGVRWVRFQRGTGDYGISVFKPSGHYAMGPFSTFESMCRYSFSRRRIDCDLEFDENDVVRPLQNYCNVGDGEDEPVGDPTADFSGIEKLIERLPLDSLSVTRHDTTVSISNHGPNAEPDLRYLIYVPFLCDGSDSVSLEQMAKAFTSSLLPHLENKTVALQFRIPPSENYRSIIEDAQEYLVSMDVSTEEYYIGALIDKEATVTSNGYLGRLHCQAAQSCPGMVVPDDSNDYQIIYDTFVVILKGQNIEAKGNVEFLLTDAIPPNLKERGYDEICIWSSDSPESTAMTLAG